MTISTITINAVGYTSYASVAQADAYLAVDPVRATPWAALTTDEKGSRLISATRRLDMLSWSGSKTGDADMQVNAWPRSNMTYEDGSAVSTSEVPKEVENATILLAGTITISASKSEFGSSGSNQKRVKAGSAEVEFFRQVGGVALQDESAYSLILQFLAASASISSGSGPYAPGSSTAQTSCFADSDEFGVNRGYS